MILKVRKRGLINEKGNRYFFRNKFLLATMIALLGLGCAQPIEDTCGNLKENYKLNV